MLKVKSGVRPWSLLIAAAAANVGAELGLEVVITSGEDGTHRTNSKHYSGEALDLRTRAWTTDDTLTFMRALSRRLGSAFQVVKERDHLHVERDLPA